MIRFVPAEHRAAVAEAEQLERAGLHAEAERSRLTATWLSDLWSIALVFGRTRDFDAVRQQFPFERWLSTREAMLEQWDACLPWDVFIERFGTRVDVAPGRWIAPGTSAPSPSTVSTRLRPPRTPAAPPGGPDGHSCADGQETH